MDDQVTDKEKNYIPLQIKSSIKLSRQQIIISVFFIIGLIISFGVYQYIKTNRPVPTPDKPVLKESEIIIAPTIEQKQNDWVNFANMTDFRDLEISGGDMWLAGLGSLIHIDFFNNKIKRVYTMLDGLASNTTTAVKKQNEFLWIGTQGGVSRLNLNNNSLQTYTVNDGLVNGSNIGFAISGADLWIGTFDGVSKYDPKTDSFINYKAELGDFATKWGVNDKLWPDSDGVWFIINANVYSTGGLTFYNKFENTWTSYGPKDITQEETNRIDLLSFSVGKDYVWTTDGKQIYQFNKKTKTWQTLTQLLEDINKQTGQNYINAGAIIGSDSVNLYIFTHNQLFSYNIKNNLLTLIYDLEEDKNNPSCQFLKMIDNYIFFKSNQALYFYDLGQNKFSQYELKGLPAVYNDILTSFKNNLVISYNNNIALFDTSFLKPTLLKPLIFEEGINGIQSVIFDQKRNVLWYLNPSGTFEGQCSQASFKKYSLDTKKIERIDLPESDSECDFILNKILAISKTNEIIIRGPDKLYIYNPDEQKQNQWQIKDLRVLASAKDSQGQLWLATENQIGIYQNGELNSQIKNIQGQVRKFIVANNNIFAIVFGNKIELVQYNLSDQQSTIINDYPVGPAEYSPFEDWNKNPTINDIALSKDGLWLATTRGLIKKDLASGKYELFTTKQGIMGNDINQIELVNNKPWVIVNWGGLAGKK